METYDLIRLSGTDQGTFGDLWVGGNHWYTGELPYRENNQSVSCVPPGTYQCDWLITPKWPDGKYHITNVPDREAIEIHSGNYCGDTTKGFRSDVLGCCLLGNTRGVCDGQMAVLESKEAVKRFEDLMNKQSFVLEIRYANPT